MQAQTPVFKTVFPANQQILSDTSFIFSWNIVKNVSHYQLRVYSDSLSTTAFSQNYILTESLPATQLGFGQTYYWHVIAYYSSGDSIVSEAGVFELFRPTCISGASLWLESDSVSLSGSNVTQWNDNSINQYILPQIDPSKQPVLLTDILNGKPVIRFDGTDDFFSIPASLPFDSLSFFIVFKKNLTTNPGMLIGSDFSDNCIANYNDGTTYIVGASGYAGVTTGHISEFSIFSVIANGSFAYVYVNKALIGAGQAFNRPMTFNAIGQRNSSQFLNGDIAEIILFDHGLNSQEQKQIEDFLHWKYDPEVNLGTDIFVPYGYGDTVISASDIYTDYLWDSGQTSQTITVNEPGNYSVTVTDIFGFTSTDEISVFYPEPYLPNDTSICLGDSLIWIPGLGNDYSYSWSDGSSDSVLVIYSQDEYYLTVTDSLGYFFQTDTFFVTIDSFQVTASLGNDTNLCSGNRIALTSGTGVSFLWPDGSTNSYYYVDTTGYYWVTAINANGCVGVDTIHVNIIGDSPVPAFMYDNTCFGQNTQFTNTSYTTDGSSIIDFYWQFGDPGTSILENPQYIYQNTGTFNVNLEIETDAGCSNDTTIFVTILPNPDANFAVSSIGCINNSLFFEDLSSMAGTDSIVYWNWDFGDTGSSSLQNPVHTYSGSGNFIVSLTVQSSNLCYDSISSSIDVYSSYPLPGSLDLLSPVNNYLTLENYILCSWNSSVNAINYKIEVSTDQNFTSIIHDFSTSDLYSVIPLTVYSELYWRVKAYNLCNDSVTSATRLIKHLSPDDYNGLTFWLVANNETNSTNDVWNDISQNICNMTQTNALYRPLVVSSAIDTFSVMRFDGINDFYSLPGDLLYDSLSLLVVFKKYNTASNGVLMGYDTTDNCIANFSDGNTYAVGNQGYASISSGHVTNYSIFSTIIDSMYIFLYINKTLSGNEQVFHSSISLNAIGQRTNGQFFSGDIAEMILFERNITYAERVELENYLHYKYAPPVNLGPDIYVNNGFCDTIISAGNSFTQYTWNTGNPGDILPTLSVSESGVYSVTVTDVFGFQSIDSINVYFNSPATFSDTTICLGDSICWNTGFSHDYIFTWQDLSSDSLIYIKEAGYYHVQIFDGACTYISDTFTVSIDSFSVIATLGPDTDLCSGNNITVMNAQASVFNWSTGATTPMIVIDTAGLYWVTALNARGCQMTDSMTVTGIHGIAPTVIFNMDHFCFADTAVFTDYSYTSDGSNITGWDWDFGDSFSSSQQNPWHYYTASGQFIVSLTVETDSNCSNILLDTMNVRALPQAGFYTSLACHNIPVSFIDTSISADGSLSIWEWNFDDSNTSFAQNPSHIFPNEGLYNITFISVTEYGCSDTTTVPLLIKESPDAGFIFSSACIGNPTYFENTSQYNTLWPPDSWSWDFGDMIDSDDKNPSHIYSTTGTHSVTMIVHTLNGCIDTVSKDVYVNPRPSADFSDLPGCEGWYYNFNESSNIVSGSITSWNWIVNNFIISDKQNPVYTFYDPGNYTVQLVVTSDSSCYDTLTRQLVINPLPDAGFTINPGYGTPTTAISMLNESGSDSYLWDFGDGSTFSGQNPVIYYADS
ncbi:MAG: PKD domain-containing protein, partial [Bacteroidota bacterium]